MKIDVPKKRKAHKRPLRGDNVKCRNCELLYTSKHYCEFCKDKKVINT